MIKLEKADFFDSPAPFDQRGFMVTNPPYGIKLEVDSSEFFADIGDNLKQNYNGWEAWIILPDDVKSIGLRHWRRFPVLNGDIECKWTGYKLFEGSKKRGDRNY
jgi:putative N6-adenine-specific DNA methylase